MKYAIVLSEKKKEFTKAFKFRHGFFNGDPSRTAAKADAYVIPFNVISVGEAMRSSQLTPGIGTDNFG